MLADNPAPPACPPTPPGARPIPTRVLLVDDEEDCRRMVINWLEGMDGRRLDGWHVTPADSADAACDLLGNAVFECILLDLGMPSVAPRDVFDKVYAAAGDVPVLVFSNNASDELYDYCISHGAAKFIPKLSVNANELADEICRAMGWRALQREAARLKARADEYRETAEHCRGRYAL